jgi:glycosyltransferase involved in cell wall biosynthesis
MKILVSVVISTYNSAEYIIETLESVIAQSWPDIELIISDDCSTDYTIEICKDWVTKYENRFRKVKILTSKENTGVSANANRGAQASSGAWIKFLGADDTLKRDCIKDNMNWIKENQEIEILFSRVEVYDQIFQKDKLIKIVPGIPYDNRGILAVDRTPISQYRMLLISDRIHFTPSVFISRKAFYDVGGFDERFKLLEDYPLWLNLTKKGYKLHFMDKITVKYRQHEKAINNKTKQYLVNPNYFKHEEFRKLYTYPNLPKDIYLMQRFYWIGIQLFRIPIFNRRNYLNRALFSMLTIYFNVFKYIVHLKKLVNRELAQNEFYQ